MSQEELRREQQETIEELKRTEDVSGQSNKMWGALSRGTGWKFTYGGWYSVSFVGASENDRGSSPNLDALKHAWENDMKYFFLGKSAKGRVKMYLRFGTQFTNNARITAAVPKSDWIQPTIEMFYMDFSFGKKSIRQKWTMGRQYAKVKNTLAFGLVADGVSYELKTRRQEIEAFVLHQLPGGDNVDFLAPRPGRSKRWFYGTQYTVKYLPSQALNFFSVFNKDANDDGPDREGQRHRLDSMYLGGTVFGMLWSRLEYEFQYIKELGTTFSDTGNLAAQEVDVSAHALYGGLKYYFYSDLRPVLHADYLFGSGDADAINVFSTTGGSGAQTVGGSGGKDNRFIAFGGKNLGYALAPTLTNLQVIKAGLSFKPFGWAQSRVWQDLKVHPQFYLFRRDKGAGATADPYIVRGAGSSKKVGHEIDLSIAWRLMSDINYQLKIGWFNPGPAYATQSVERFLRMKISLDL